MLMPLGPLAMGERLPGFIKAIRDDGKIDLIISQRSSAAIIALEEKNTGAFKSLWWRI